MKATLKVKNFGPIVDAELDLRNVNVFIGPQASGKSTLAKLFAICRSPLNYFLDEQDDDLLYYDELSGGKKGAISRRFLHELKKLNLQSFLKDDTFFEYDSDLHKILYKDRELILDRKFHKGINEFGELIASKELHKANLLIQEIYTNNSLVSVYGSFAKFLTLKVEEGFSEKELEFLKGFDFKKENFNLKELNILYKRLKETEQSILKGSLYIPAERLIIPILKGAALNLQAYNVPIPKHILGFAAEYEKALTDFREFDLSFLSHGFSLKIENGKERFYFNKNESVLLSESATGIQSLVPLLLPIFSFQDEFSQAYVIEEPEMNLYPEAQYKLIKYLESSRMEEKIDTTYSHLYTTHSPYILASFNNMLYAYKKSQKLKEDKAKLKEVEEVIAKENWLNPNNFNAYTIIEANV